MRFDLRRRGETENEFYNRTNAQLGKNERNESDDGRWKFGPNSVSSGSLHCDEWVGPAIDLLTRDIICIKPVMGWWRDRASAAICNKSTRYSLVVTISTPEQDLDLYTPISNLVDTNVGVETEISV